MKVLVVGAGGREHALSYALKKSPQLTELHVTPGNGGIAQLAQCWGVTDLDSIVTLAVEKGIGLVFIGQEDYLVKGLSEKLTQKGILVVGPSAAAAQLEGSKAFSKAFMARHQIPTAKHQTCTDFPSAQAFLETLTAPFVIKASGLAAGKGVVITQTLDQALDAVKSMLGGQFGPAGEELVIEEFMDGEEASFFVFSDGQDFVTLPALQDHKRIFELDAGPNTGGMGCYCPAPVVTERVERQVIEEVVKPTLNGMAKEGHPYQGVLYIGLMIKDNQAKVVEYNIRFGDPECQPLMMLFDDDLIEVGKRIAQGNLAGYQLKWKNQSAGCVVLAAEGYPGASPKGSVIQGLEEVELSDQVQVFHAGSLAKEGRFVTHGGRVLSVTALGADLPSALKSAYQEAAKIHWPGMQMRRDIGLKGLKQGRPTGLKVGVLLGSGSDKKVADKATVLLKQFGVNYELKVSSAHRSPERTRQVLRTWVDQGVEVVVAIAGMAAALPGVVAAEVDLPVIGVPVSGRAFGGQDALLSIVQMPPGIPVATVGVDRGDNAAVLALQILGIKYPGFRAAHVEYRIGLAQKVVADSDEIQ